MRGFVRHTVLLAVTGLLAASVPAGAQRGMRGDTRGQYPEGGAAQIGVLPPVAPGIASLVLEHAADFSLADAQRTALESVRRAQDSANAPWMARLDSLRPTRMPAGGPSDLSQEQRDEMSARKAAVKNVMEGMRETNAQARTQVMAILNADQQKRAAEFEDDARKRADDTVRRQRDSQQAGGRRRGRPTED